MISYFFGMRGCLNWRLHCWQSILDLCQPLGPSFLCICGVTGLPYRSANFVTWWFSYLVTKLVDFLRKWRIFRGIISSRICFHRHFLVSLNQKNVHILKAYSFSLRFRKTWLFAKLCWHFISCKCFYMFLKRQNARNLVTTTHFWGFNFFTPPPPHKYLKEKKNNFFK
jgi:hypothetical protein